ncbi:MAG: dTDP-4-dehydrorhamnose reductase [Betaproteobacteria bacterium]|nr:dTDP-4-dehydrorhamnose reductase [Betaproteobacteria bacterium]
MTHPRYLIVGASGVLGSRLHAAIGDHAVVTYCSHAIPGGVRFDAATMRLSDVVLRGREPFSHAFLMQGVTNIDACARDPAGTREVNVKATCRVIDDLVEHGVTPVFASSDAVFGGERGSWTEDDLPHPILTYGRQKLEVEDYLAAKNSPWLVARLAKVVGTRRSGDILEEWMEKLDAGAPIRCATDQVFSPVHVADAVQALMRLAAGAHSGVFNVGGPAAVTRLELLRTLIEEVRKYRAPSSQVITCSLRDFAFAEARPLDTSMSPVKLQAALGAVCRDMKAACEQAAAVRYAELSGAQQAAAPAARA